MLREASTCWVLLSVVEEQVTSEMKFFTFHKVEPMSTQAFKLCSYRRQRQDVHRGEVQAGVEHQSMGEEGGR